MAGGPHTSALPESVLEAGADAAFVGEGEESLPRFLNDIAESGGGPKQGIIPPMPLGDFDSYPPFAHRLNFLAPIEIRRGCSVGCAFCQTSRIFTKVRERSIDYITRYGRHINRRP